jgi:2-oxoglutarate dehydrogenase E2 component (dihydrolipoamide succinyltransferase)
MTFSLTMPALGESVTEGTVTRWLKAEGDHVAVDEPLLEVSTDKVDTEIPSPVAGTLQKIVVGVDQTVAVGAELAVIADGAAAPAAPAAPVAAPVAAVTPPAPAPAPAPASAAADDLSRIKGVGPKLVALLGELGVTSYAQIAAWNEADVARIDDQLGRFAGRITRDQWIEQAKLLSLADEAGFAERFGRNG